MQNAELPEGFVYVSDLIPDVREDMVYATTHNFVGAPVDGYLAQRAILTRKAAQALELVSLAAHGDGYRLVIFDAYRPERAVRHFMRWSEDAADTLSITCGDTPCERMTTVPRPSSGRESSSGSVTTPFSSMRRTTVSLWMMGPSV